jgi:hypothetical protein
MIVLSDSAYQREQSWLKTAHVERNQASASDTLANKKRNAKMF